MAEQERPEHLDGDSARAGSTPHMTRYILAISLVLVIALFVVIYFLKR